METFLGTNSFMIIYIILHFYVYYLKKILCDLENQTIERFDF